jgi:hypothetical protein
VVTPGPLDLGLGAFSFFGRWRWKRRGHYSIRIYI